MTAEGCGTNPPVTPVTPTMEYGSLYVSANIDSGLIVLDNSSTEKYAPDTITASVGTHVVRLDRMGFTSSSQTVRVGKDSLTSTFITLVAAGVQKVVLIEDFSNVSCVPCVVSNAILEALTNRTYGRAKLVAIKYPTNFPAPNDPFYLANRTDANARMTYYNILFAPTTILDGTARPTSSDSVAMKDSINVRLLLPPRFNITIADSSVGGIYYASVRVQTLDTSGTGFNDLVLHTVVTETDISFTTPPGSNGETEFFDVMRAMLPTRNGEALASGNRTGTVMYSRQVVIGSGWNVAKLHTVAFVQNTRTKVIFQTGSTF